MIIVLCIHIGLIIFDRYIYMKDFSGNETQEEETEEKLKKLLRERREMEGNTTGRAANQDDDINDLGPGQIEELMLQSYKDEYYSGYNYGMLMKFLLQCILLGIVHYMVFWYLPNTGNKKLTGQYICPDGYTDCNDVTSNVWLALFYLLFCIYFAISAVQIRNGWPEIRNMKTVRKKVSVINATAVNLYLAIPFVYELQSIMDWAFTRTSLNIFQWMKFEDIYANTYLAKYTYKTLQKSEFGKAIGAVFKYSLSCIGITLIILLVIGPMIIFSSLNPIAQGNKITGATVTFGIYANQMASNFQLFSTSQIVSLTDMNSTKFSQEGLNKVDSVKTLDQTLMQSVIMQQYADTEWRPTSQAKNGLLNYLDPDSTITNEIKFYLGFAFNRPYDSEYAKSQFAFTKSIDLTVRSSLLYAISKCKYFSTNITDLYKKVIKLPSDESYSLLGTNDPDLQSPNVTLELNCTNMEIVYNNNTYSFPTYSWELGAGGKGIEFITWSEQVTTQILGYSAITLYISVVIVIGNLIKGITRGGSRTVVIDNMPEPEGLLNLCEGIIIYRLGNNLKM